MKPPVPFRWRGNHHAYYGIFSLVFGGTMWFMANNHGLPKLNLLWLAFMVVGIVCITDDIIEHTITRSTPLRIIYEKVFQRWTE